MSRNSGNIRYSERRPYDSGRNPRLDRERRAARKRRRRNRLVKGLIAWAVYLLPGGFEMVLNSDIKGQNPSGESGYKSVDRREDRMSVFSDLAVEPSVFTYKIRAVNKGVYTLPPVQAEAMYNRSLQAHSAGGVMVVE